MQILSHSPLFAAKSIQKTRKATASQVGITGIKDTVRFSGARKTPAQVLLQKSKDSELQPLVMPYDGDDEKSEYFKTIDNPTTEIDRLRAAHATSVASALADAIEQGTFTDVEPIWFMEPHGGGSEIDRYYEVKGVGLTIPNGDQPVFVELHKVIDPESPWEGTVRYLITDARPGWPKTNVTSWSAKSWETDGETPPGDLVADYRQFSEDGRLIFNVQQKDQPYYQALKRLNALCEEKGFFEPLSQEQQLEKAEASFQLIQSQTGNDNASARGANYEHIFRMPIGYQAKLKYFLAGLQDPHFSVYHQLQHKEGPNLLKEEAMPKPIRKALEKLLSLAPKANVTADPNNPNRIFYNREQALAHPHDPFSQEFLAAERKLKNLLKGAEFLSNLKSKLETLIPFRKSGQ